MSSLKLRSLTPWSDIKLASAAPFLALYSDIIIEFSVSAAAVNEDDSDDDSSDDGSDDDDDSDDESDDEESKKKE